MDMPKMRALNPAESIVASAERVRFNADGYGERAAAIKADAMLSDQGKQAKLDQLKATWRGDAWKAGQDGAATYQRTMDKANAMEQAARASVNANISKDGAALAFLASEFTAKLSMAGTGQVMDGRSTFPELATEFRNRAEGDPLAQRALRVATIPTLAKLSVDSTVPATVAGGARELLSTFEQDEVNAYGPDFQQAQQLRANLPAAIGELNLALNTAEHTFDGTMGNWSRQIISGQSAAPRNGSEAMFGSGSPELAGVGA